MSEFPLYTTLPDECEGGCGTPLFFLYLPQRLTLMLWCPCCEGLWDEFLFVQEDPPLYNPRDFRRGEIALPSLCTICNQWTRHVSRISGEDANYYRARLFTAFRGIIDPCLITLNPDWLTPTVRQLAAAIDNEPAFDRMPILADALEEAGCDNEDVLQHCRNGDEHVRGCWVVDLVLGKE